MNQAHAEQAVAQLVDAWATAELRGDAAFLESTLADDFVGIGPLGFMLTKQEWIGRHQAGDLKYELLTLDEMGARVYHDTAIVIARQVQQGAYRGNSINAQFRTTLVFVKYPRLKAGGFYRPVSLWATSWPRNKMVIAELWSRSSSAPQSG